MKKRFILTVIFIVLITPVFAQTEITEQEEDTSHEFVQAENFISFIHSMDFIIQMEPGVYLNMESKLISAPSPIIYPLTIGILWPNYTKIAVQPTLSFYSMEYLWYDEMALPAEIENRTVSSLSFMITIPVVFSLYFKTSRLQIMPGFSILARFGLLSNNVNPEDSGYSGSAESDKDLINEWFWKDMHFLYLTAGASWLFNISGNLKAGPVINISIPFSMITAGEGLQNTCISAGLKLSL